MTRPFKVLGIQQIAIGNASKQRLHALWVQMLGLQVTGTFRSERENVDEDICAMGSGPFKVEVDLMQPLDESTHCSSRPVRYVLEMNQGWFSQRKLQAGMKLKGLPVSHD